MHYVTYFKGRGNIPIDIVCGTNFLREGILTWLCVMSGPAFFESLAVFPSSSRFVVDVNLGNNSVEIAQNQIQAAIKYLGWDRIYSLERKVHDCC